MSSFILPSPFSNTLPNAVSIQHCWNCVKYIESESKFFYGPQKTAFQTSRVKINQCYFYWILGFQNTERLLSWRTSQFSVIRQNFSSGWYETIWPHSLSGSSFFKTQSSIKSVRLFFYLSNNLWLLNLDVASKDRIVRGRPGESGLNGLKPIRFRQIGNDRACCDQIRH